MTRFFGGTQTKYQTDITTLAGGISNAGLKLSLIHICGRLLSLTAAQKKCRKEFTVSLRILMMKKLWQKPCVDGTFFKDFKVSGSFYYANTYNQTFDPKITVSSGYSTLYVQTGYVRNLGVEGLSLIHISLHQHSSA